MLTLLLTNIHYYLIIFFCYFRRDEPLTIKTKYLVYKGCKKNVHRLWKLNGDKNAAKSSGGGQGSQGNSKYSKSGIFGTGLNGRDDEKLKRMTDQTIQDNIRTTEKMNQLRLKMELASARKKLKSIKYPMRNKYKSSGSAEEDEGASTRRDLQENGIEQPMTSHSKSKDHFSDKVIQRQHFKQVNIDCGSAREQRNLSAESRMKIKENLSRNRSFKTILNPPTPALTSSSSMSLFNSDVNPLEAFCFGGSTGDVLGPSSSSSNKLGRSLSFQSNYVFNRTDSNLCMNSGSGVNSLATMESATISNSTPMIQEYVNEYMNSTKLFDHHHHHHHDTSKSKESTKSCYSTSMQDLLLQEILTKSTNTSSGPSNCRQLYGGSSASAALGNGSSRDFSSANNLEFNEALAATTSGALKIKSDYDRGGFNRNGAIAKTPKYQPQVSLPEDYFNLNHPRMAAIGAKKKTDNDSDPMATLQKQLQLNSFPSKDTSEESLLEFYENLTSSSTSSLASSKLNDYSCFSNFNSDKVSANRHHHFYHSDLDLNQLNDRFQNKLSISHQDINQSDMSKDDDWSGSNLLLPSLQPSCNDTKDESPQLEYNILEDVNYDKFLNDLLNNDFTIPTRLSGSEYKRSGSNDSDDSGCCKGVPNRPQAKDNNELFDMFGSDLDSTLLKKSTSKYRLKPADKLKSFGSNPTLLGHHSLSTNDSNLTTTTSTTTIIPQLSRLDAIPTKYRRGYINLNDACMSNSATNIDHLSTGAIAKTPKPTLTNNPHFNYSSMGFDVSNKKQKDHHNSFHHGSSIFHYQSAVDPDYIRGYDIPDNCTKVNDRIAYENGAPVSGSKESSSGSTNSSGRQSRFEYCNYYSNLSQFPPHPQQRNTSKTTASTTTTTSTSAKGAPPYESSSNFDFQSDENLFNMNFDSFYDDFVDSPDVDELSWSSTSSSTSFGSNSSANSTGSLIIDKKYVILPEIKLDVEVGKVLGATGDETLTSTSTIDVAEAQQQQKASQGKLRCAQCNKKLGIIMIMKCHCNKYFCSAHRYMETHNCDYNYKLEGKKKIERENPQVVSQKLPKI